MLYHANAWKVEIGQLVLGRFHIYEYAASQDLWACIILATNEHESLCSIDKEN
jgi:hypothetical protein